MRKRRGRRRRGGGGEEEEMHRVKIYQHTTKLMYSVFIEYLPHAPLCYEHMQESAYVHLHFYKF